MHEITRILSAIEQGDPHYAEQLLPLVYDELRKLAAQKMAQEKPGHTLQATDLVHEAYLRLVPPPRSPASQGAETAETPPSPVGAGAVHWNSRGHFFAAAAEAMRRILVERARHKKSVKGGGGLQQVALADVAIEEATGDDLLLLHEALDKLEKKDKRKAELVKLRFFAGLTNEQAAGVLGVSTSTADNDWAYARSWLRLEIGGEAGGDPTPLKKSGKMP